MNETTWTKYEKIDDLPSKLFVEIPKEGEDLPEFDISKLNRYYYLPCNNEVSNDKDNPIDRKNQSCKAIEDEIERIMQREGWTRRDVYRILAWKIGKIKHPECQENNKDCINDDGSFLKFIYHENCSEPVETDEPKIQLPNGKTIEGRVFNDFADKVIKLRSEYIIQPNNPNIVKEIWNRLVTIASDDSLKGIGTVYLLTLLSFITKGEMPIFDRFAMAAIVVKHLETLKNKNNEKIRVKRESVIHISGLPDKKQKSASELFNTTSIYEQYKELLKRYFPNNWQKREVDRALWVYGHYFKVTY